MVSRMVFHKIGLGRLMLSVAALVVITAILLLASPVGAHHALDNMFKTATYGPDCFDAGNSTPHTSNFCQTDNSALTVFRESSLSVSGKSNIAFVLNNWYDPTDLSVTIETSGTYTGSAETDIIYQKRDDIPGALVGVAWCYDAVTTLKCDQHYVAFDAVSPATNLICHETGHAVGLTHGAQASPAIDDDDDVLDCMENPPGASSGVLGTHNTGIINSTY